MVRAAGAESRPAGSSASGPSSSGPVATDSSESERDDSQEPGQEVVVSLLSKLRSPRPSVENCIIGREKSIIDTSLLIGACAPCQHH